MEYDECVRIKGLSNHPPSVLQSTHGLRSYSINPTREWN